MHAIAPPPPERTPSTLRELPFSWHRCPRHVWLGVSVLVVRGQTPVCMPQSGGVHPVDPAELRAAR